jgi:hypothetical protein
MMERLHFGWLWWRSERVIALMPNFKTNAMKNKIIRNIGLIALIAVWSFLAGAYLHLGWMREGSMSFLTSFIVGGISVWIVFTGMGILVYRIAKRSGSSDAAKPALGVVSFFTVIFLLLAWIKYDEVMKDKFLEDIEESFVLHFENKAKEEGIVIVNLEDELQDLYFSIQSDLRRDPELEKVMKLTTADDVFEKNRMIANKCLETLDMKKQIGYPAPDGMEKLFD